MAKPFFVKYFSKIPPISPLNVFCVKIVCSIGMCVLYPRWYFNMKNSLLTLIVHIMLICDAQILWPFHNLHNCPEVKTISKNSEIGFSSDLHSPFSVMSEECIKKSEILALSCDLQQASASSTVIKVLGSSLYLWQ